MPAGNALPVPFIYAHAKEIKNQQYKDKVRKVLHQRGDGEDAAAQYVLFKSMLGEAIRNETAPVVNCMKSLAAKIATAAK